ncbi:MAG TPA: fatty acid desaturase [bacterium]|nr:fatty acid desaturase [bacterium]
MSTSQKSLKGVIIAFTLLVLWAGNLAVLLMTPLTRMPVPIIALGLLLQTFLYTGLFITAHDAMHGSVYRKNKRLNDMVGRLAVLLYALFSYRLLITKHGQHHKHPASDRDPDYHDGKYTGFIAWYVRFLLNYLRWPQILGMAIVFNLLLHLAGVHLPNLLLFWVLPALVSTLQLFYFGTYLPHREPAGGYTNRHRARSNEFPLLLSFFSCYHFGYHWEHHEFPGVPWWLLPGKRREIRAASSEAVL